MRSRCGNKSVDGSDGSSSNDRDCIYEIRGSPNGCVHIVRAVSHYEAPMADGFQVAAPRSGIRPFRAQRGESGKGGSVAAVPLAIGRAPQLPHLCANSSSAELKQREF